MKCVAVSLDQNCFFSLLFNVTMKHSHTMQPDQGRRRLVECGNALSGFRSFGDLGIFLQVNDPKIRAGSLFGVSSTRTRITCIALPHTFTMSGHTAIKFRSYIHRPLNQYLRFQAPRPSESLLPNYLKADRKRIV